jgi:hypothetical protein
MAGTSDRRTLERRHLAWYCLALERATGRELGRLADIHTAGLLLVAPEALPVGERFDAEVVVPRGVTAPLAALPATLEVRWVRPDVNPGLQAIGCRFVAPLADPAAILLLIDYLGFDR